MAHELTIHANGAVEMAFTGSGAWHGLGNELPAGASIEAWKSAAGMQWTIERAPVFYRADCAETGPMMGYPDRTVLYRSDNRAPLGLVSPDYQIVQPGTVLEFFRDLVSDNGMTLETAGTLFGGRRFWALANIADSIVTGADKVGGYLLLSTSADGTMATEARETTVRVVCNNTLRLARSADGAGVAPIKIGHRVKFDDRAVKAKLGFSREQFERGMDTARALAAIRVSQAGAENFVRQLLRPDDAKKTAAAGSDYLAKLLANPAGMLTGGDDAAGKRAPRGEAAILGLFSGAGRGAQLPGVAGTAWGLVNAVTEYVDHQSTAKSSDHRMSNAWFGDGDALKTRALDAAMMLA